MVRYIIFASQFFLLLKYFGVPVTLIQGLTGIGLTYFLITFMPVSSLAELGIRGSVAVFVFGLFISQTGGVILATMSLWVINLAIPALTGAWVVAASGQRVRLPGFAKRSI